MKIGNKPLDLTWKIRIKIVILTIVMYAIVNYILQLIFPIYKQPVTSIISQSLIFGILFGFGFIYFFQKNSTKITGYLSKKIEVSLDENEKIIFEGPANLFRGLEAVGGKIFLTETHLVFNSHKLNIQSGATKIPYTSIEELLPCKTAKFIDNGLKIITKEGVIYQFVINERETWVQHLREFMK